LGYPLKAACAFQQQRPVSTTKVVTFMVLFTCIVFSRKYRADKHHVFIPGDLRRFLRRNFRHAHPVGAPSPSPRAVSPHRHSRPSERFTVNFIRHRL
jgi:formate-dependent nitrite reductase cytochrome c552 subunit